MNMINKWYLPALLWLLIVTGLSVSPSVPLPKFDLFSADKLGHLAAYGILSWLLLYGHARATGQKASTKAAFFIFVMSCGYGILMEFVQGTFIPGRFYEIDDMIANGAGAALAWALNGTKLLPAEKNKS